MKMNKLRLSGCEPTLGKEHLLSALADVAESKYTLFILETNGIVLGSDRDYVKGLAKFADKLYVRISFKAATPESFTERIGALGSYYELPFKALKYLLDEGIYARAAAMTGPKVMPRKEREILLRKLREIDPGIAADLEEEQIDAYKTTINLLKAFDNAEFAKELEKTIENLKPR